MAWSTTNATTMNSMFKGASSFNQPIVGTEGDPGDPGTPPTYPTEHMNETFDNLNDWSVYASDQPYTVAGSFEVVASNFGGVSTGIVSTVDFSAVGTDHVNITADLTTDLFGQGSSSAPRVTTLQANFGGKYAQLRFDDRNPNPDTDVQLQMIHYDGTTLYQSVLSYIPASTLSAGTSIRMQQKADGYIDFYVGGVLQGTTQGAFFDPATVQLSTLELWTYSQRSPTFTATYDNVIVEAGEFDPGTPAIPPTPGTGLDTSNVTDMSSMFSGATSFNQPLAGGESSGGDPIIEAVNSATLTGTEYYNISSTPTVLSAGTVATSKVVWAFRFKTSTTGKEFQFHNGDANDNNNNISNQ